MRMKISYSVRSLNILFIIVSEPFITSFRQTFVPRMKSETPLRDQFNEREIAWAPTKSSRRYSDASNGAPSSISSPVPPVMTPQSAPYTTHPFLRSTPELLDLPDLREALPLALRTRNDQAQELQIKHLQRNGASFFQRRAEEQVISRPSTTPAYT